MVTIEHLEVMFEAAEVRDEVVFAHLFARHIATYDQARSRADENGRRVADERAVSNGSSW